MPIYEYVCTKCGRKLEVLQGMGEGSDGLVCGACGDKTLTKVFSLPNIGKGGGAAAPAPTGGCSTGCCGGSCGL